jgi:hypothetical protein
MERGSRTSFVRVSPEVDFTIGLVFFVLVEFLDFTFLYFCRQLVLERCDTSLPDQLNYFYARFEASSTETCMRVSSVLDDCVIMFSTADVSKTFKQVHIHRAVVSDELPGHVL